MTEQKQKRNNIVSIPPLKSPISSNNGVVTLAWATWFRDIFDRVASKEKKGNAIDDINSTVEENNNSVVNQLNSTNTSLKQAVEQINDNSNQTSNVKTNLDSHIKDKEIHKKVAAATTSVFGLVKQMQSIVDVAKTTATVVANDVSDADDVYSKAQVQSLVTLANQNKSQINLLAEDLNKLITAYNLLISNSKVAGQMTSDQTSQS